MKKYFLIWLLAACTQTNPKEAIVERQKEIKKELKQLHNKQMQDNLASKKTGVDLDINLGSPEQSKLVREYDSLEFELKKY